MDVETTRQELADALPPAERKTALEPPDVQTIQPDVLVKGADWAEDAIVGRDTVEARGGKVVRVPLEQGFSTTDIIRRIRALP